MQWIRVAAVALVAAAVTWVAIPTPECPQQPPLKTDTHAVSSAETPLTGLEYPYKSVDVRRRGPDRNPFDYVVIAREEPVVAMTSVVVEQPPVITPPPPAEIGEQLPRFDYRYIGRFGPRHDPVAAFARDGEVITVRRGDTIGGRFVVRHIGANDVEIGIVDRTATLKLSLDGWI